MDVIFHLQENEGYLLFAKYPEVVFHFKLSKMYLTALVYISSHFEPIPVAEAMLVGLRRLCAGNKVKFMLAQLELSSAICG